MIQDIARQIVWLQRLRYSVGGSLKLGGLREFDSSSEAASFMFTGQTGT